jgi:hypothetical protein
MLETNEVKQEEFESENYKLDLRAEKSIFLIC